MTDLTRITANLQSYVKQLKGASSEIERLKGQRGALVEQLTQKFGISNAADADIFLAEKEEERVQLLNQLDRYMEELDAFFNKR